MKISGILLFILVIVLLMASYHVIEGFRGGRRGGGRRGGGIRGGGRRGGGIRGGGRRGGGGARRAIRRAVARQGGGHRGRRGFGWRRGPRTVVYDSQPYNYGGWRDYYNGLPYLSSYVPSWLWGARCRSGCGYLGNGAVGCVNPTNTPDSCIFASDCYGC